MQQSDILEEQGREQKIRNKEASHHFENIPFQHQLLHH